MDLPICINGVHTGCSGLRYLPLRDKRLKSIFHRPGFTMAGREKLLNRLIQKNWEIYLRHIQSIKSERLERIVTFKRFADFPPEIRDLIWKYSLPGPRILYLNPKARPILYDKNTQSSLNSLEYLKYHNPPNPSALITCRASRAVALKRYRTIPHLGLVYTDFAGGDILYIDRNNLESFRDFLLDSNGNPKSSILELNMVEQIILAENSFGWHFWELPRFFRAFPNLKQISLNVHPEAPTDPFPWSHGPGIVQMDHLNVLINSNKWSQSPLWLERWMSRIRTGDDKAKGLRNVAFISTSIVANFPGDDWLVDMAEHDETLSLLLKELREKVPGKKQPKRKSTTAPKKSSTKNSEVRNTVSEPACKETTAQRYQRRVNRKIHS